MAAGGVKQFRHEWLKPWKQRVGTPVFIVEVLHSYPRVAGTVYESIKSNQSVFLPGEFSQASFPRRVFLPGEFSQESFPPRIFFLPGEFYI
jgi:hypothetical protein